MFELRVEEVSVALSGNELLVCLPSLKTDAGGVFYFAVVLVRSLPRCRRRVFGSCVTRCIHLEAITPEVYLLKYNFQLG